MRHPYWMRASSIFLAQIARGEIGWYNRRPTLRRSATRELMFRLQGA